MIRLSHVTSAITFVGLAWIIQPISLFRLPVIGTIAQAQQFSPSATAPTKAAPPEKVVNDLKSYQSLRIQVGSDTYLVDKADMTHFLTRHHPSYWDGSTKQKQTFFNKSMTVSDIEQAIKSVMSTRRSEVIKIGPIGTGTLPDTQVGGVTYVLGLNKGHVGQFYPVVP